MNNLTNLKDNDVYQAQSMAMTIEKAAVCLHNSIKYIYAVSQNDFYNINVKDLFKISLSDINNPHILTNLGISPANSAAFKCEVFSSEQYAKLVDLFYFAFAVRTPFLMKNPSVQQAKIKAKFFQGIYNACIERGAADHDDIVRETFKINLKLAKSNKPEPSFNGEWFRRWIYSHNSELSAITNRNMFLLGCMDALLPLYYAKLTEMLLEEIKRNSKSF